MTVTMVRKCVQCFNEARENVYYKERSGETFLIDDDLLTEMYTLMNETDYHLFQQLKSFLSG